ncbi:MAG: ATP synthase F1 subunit delta [Nitrospiraceae bacterium]|nr:ATP synthase F1 subunit delta [Nitrospiraceae bacterium]
MKNYLVAERYAKGLSAAIPDNAALDDAVTALYGLSDLYETEHDFRSAVSNPAIDKQRRSRVLAAVLQHIGVPDVVARLAEVLLERGRIAVISDVAEVFRMIANERLGRIRATVTTAVPLSAGQETRLGKALETYSGKTVRVKPAVDPEILGGVVVRMGDAVIDGSVRTRLNSLRDALLSEEK